LQTLLPEGPMPVPRVLVLYGTVNGHTRKIAFALADTLRAAAFDVDVVNVRKPFDPNPSDYMGVVVAAPIRGQRYPRAVRRWVKAHADALRDRPTAFVSSCLAVLERNAKTDAAIAAIMQRLFGATDWRPTMMKSVAGALPYTQYNWVTRWMMRRIVARAHGDVDTSRDYEYTDWDDLRQFGRDFARTLVGSPSIKVAS
jgi:menaquinone-dependent protoporphyrinogen oxidase